MNGYWHLSGWLCLLVSLADAVGHLINRDANVASISVYHWLCLFTRGVDYVAVELFYRSHWRKDGISLSGCALKKSIWGVADAIKR